MYFVLIGKSTIFGLVGFNYKVIKFNFIFKIYISHLKVVDLICLYLAE